MTDDPDLVLVNDWSGGVTNDGLPVFPMPRYSWTPAPFTISGSMAAGTDTTKWWMVLSPNWRCTPMPWGGANSDAYVCPTTDVCAVHGPRCSGAHNSGEIYGIFPRGNALPQQVTVTTPGAVNPIFNPDGTITYQTQHPYAPGSLQLSFQGQALVKGVDYDELDPRAGTFIVYRLVPEENAGELYVEYYGYGDQNTVPLPGVPPTEPGMPPPTPLPGPGGFYRPANQRQFGWGTVYDSVNCNMACSAMLLDRHTLGANTRYVGYPQSIPPSHRFYSNVTAITGTGHDDAARAWKRGWGQSYTYPGPVGWSYWVFQVQSGRGSTVFGRYSAMDSQYKKSRTYDGPHAIYINEQLQDGSFWGYDPIVGYPIVYPYSVLYNYARSYHGTDSRIEAGYSRITPKVTA